MGIKARHDETVESVQRVLKSSDRFPVQDEGT